MKKLFTAFLMLLFQFTLTAQWVTQPSGVTNILGSVHFVDEYNGHIVGSEGLILHTTNGGTNWNPQTSGTTTWFQDVFFINLNKGWAVGQNGLILHTTNGGAEWISQNSGTTRELYQVVFTDSLHGWISADWGEMLYTSNGGASWSFQNTGLNSSILSVHFINSSYGWAVGSLGIIIHTTNGGAQWINQISGTTEQLESVFFTDSNNGWAVGEGGTILHTTNGGGEWLAQTSGFSSFLFSVHFSTSYNGWAVGPSGTALHTTNGGFEWLFSQICYENLLEVFFIDSLNGWTVGDYGKILKYTTEEMEIDWCNLQSPPQHTMDTNDSVEVFARVFVDSITNPPGPGYGISAWIGYHNENTNPNLWENWVEAEFNTDIGANDEFSIYLRGLDSGIYYYASRFQLYNGGFYYGGYPNGFWDGASNVSGVLNVIPSHVIEWCNLASPSEHTMTMEDSVEIYAQVFVDGVTNVPGQGAEILAWIGYNTENSNPSTWSNWILADYNQDVGGNDEYSQFLSALDTGTYYYASKFQIDESDYYYGGYPNGFWNGINNVSGVLTVNPVVSVDENNTVIFSYVLNQNYPNPFNPTTKIGFDIPEINFVTIKVFDVLGNEKATLVNEEKSAGKYEVEFNASDLSSGVYFYQLKTGAFIQTKKMLLLK